MTIAQIAKKLRHAADVLDDLLGMDRPTRHETAATAQKIRATLTGKRGRKKGHNYHGTHWTQLPRNRPRVVALAKRRAKMRLAS